MPIYLSTLPASCAPHCPSPQKSPQIICFFFLFVALPHIFTHSLRRYPLALSLSFNLHFFRFVEGRKLLACLFCVCVFVICFSFWCYVTSGVIMVKCRHLAKAFGWLWHRFLCKKHISHTNGNSSLCTFVSQPRLAT